MAAVEQMAAAASTAWLPAPIPEVQVHMPKVTSDKRRAVLPAHDMRLPALFAAWAQSLTPDDVVLVNEFLRDGVGELNFGSMCSGSDIPALVVKAFADFCRDFWGAEPSFRHTFACEKDEQKRKFIAEVHAHVEHLFRDVHEMTQATAVDVKLDKAVPTPSSSVFAAGFPCQDCSALNPNASSDQNRSCIAQGSLRTGSVFHGIVTYLEGRMRSGDDPDIVLLENVASFKNRPNPRGKAAPRPPSNLQWAAHFLKDRCGRVLHAWQLSPDLFGVPQMRNRIWMTAVRASDLKDLLTLQEYHAELNSIMDELVGFVPTPIEEYMVPDENLRLVCSMDFRVVPLWFLQIFCCCTLQEL